jgi:hypothetical protein
MTEFSREFGEKAVKKTPKTIDAEIKTADE